MRREKLRLRPYRPGDFDKFTPRADFAAEQEAMDWPLRNGFAPPGYAYTLLRGYAYGVDQTVCGIGGVIDYGDGDGFHAWACLADLPRRDWPQALWLANRVLTQVARVGKVQAHARCDAAVRCLARLGFNTEGPDLNVLGHTYKTMIRSA